MISQKLQEAINVQIAAEMWSSNLYLSMSFYFKKLGYDGFANWMRKQSQEELEHAYDLADYVSKRGGVAKVDKIDVVPQEWESVLDAFEKDKASQDFLWGYVREQVEEEATALGIVEKLKRCKDEASILYMDEKLGER